ncbi:MAG: peptide/nickel transport system substrate-binding protein, partial [Mycobacteriales bacterium]
MTFIRRGLPALVAAALALALAGCGAASSAGGSGTAVLNWASSYFPTHWDPVVGGSGAQFRELALVYASLTRTDAAGKAVPDLAQ